MHARRQLWRAAGVHQRPSLRGRCLAVEGYLLREKVWWVVLDFWYVGATVCRLRIAGDSKSALHQATARTLPVPGG